MTTITCRVIGGYDSFMFIKWVYELVRYTTNQCSKFIRKKPPRPETTDFRQKGSNGLRQTL